MHSNLDFTKCALSNGFSKDILAYFALMGLQLELYLRDLLHYLLFRLLGFITY